MRFYKASVYQERNERWFRDYRERILLVMAYARIEHIGSSAIPAAISKGDLDIFVAVPEDKHSSAIGLIESLGFRIKQDTLRTKDLCMLECMDRKDIAVQLVVNQSQFESFITFRDMLLADEKLRDEYNLLKKQCTGLSTGLYREKKSHFIEQVLAVE